jgi:predicted methyltransferase
MLLEVLDYLLGVKWLATGGCWTVILALTAQSAGIKVEQVLPSEVLDFGYAKGLSLFQVDGLEGALRAQVSESHIGKGGEEVKVL